MQYRFFPVVLALVPGVIAACKGQPADDASKATGDAQVTAAVTVAGPSADAGGDADAPTNGPRVTAVDILTPVFSAPEFAPKDPTRAAPERQGVIRLGYLRAGATVAVKPEQVKRSSCPEGWWELVEGGFVCGKSVTNDPNDKRLENSLHPPLTDGPLPYEYGLNLTNGTPEYRRMPLRKERAEFEKALPVGKGAKVEDGAGADAPWWLKKHEGRPQVTMDDLKGENGLIIQRMVRGFYLSLDKEVSLFSGKFWRTENGWLVPADHILVHQSTTEFKGVAIGSPGEDRHLPLAWILGLHAHPYTIDENDKEKPVRRGADHIDRFTIVQLTGQRKVIDGKGYHETKDGWWMRDLDGTYTNPGAAPSDLKPGEKWIDVNLTKQSLVAFEGDKPVYATIISSGRHNDEDKSKDHRTVTGEFSIREKHVAATMDDDGTGEGPYSIEDVPWIMYFKGSYALHGAFWHSSFGHERSHGCVNLTPYDAKNIFGWVGPRLPAGWHGVRATEANPGTRVIVHD